MGRGVDRLRNADGVTFFDVSAQGYNSGWGDWQCPECDETETGYDEDAKKCEECEVAMVFTENTDYDEDRGREDWDDFKSNFIGAITAKYKSLEEVQRRWDSNEVRIILENRFCEIALSEYMGCASLSIRAKEGDGYGDSADSLAGAWVAKVWPGMLKAIDKEMPWANRLNRIRRVLERRVGLRKSERRGLTTHRGTCSI